MTAIHSKIMNTLYKSDIWDGFRPEREMDSEIIQGWNGYAPSLKRLVSIPHDSKVVIDVGVWKGQSTITLANAMKAAGINGCVIGVDTFLGSFEHWTMDTLYRRHHAAPDLYNTFLNNVYYSGLTDYILPLPQSSINAARVLKVHKITASLVHIDEAHEYDEVIADARAYWGLLQPGGLLVGDDYHYTWPGVVKAAAQFSLETAQPLAIEVPKWIIQKPA